jgi:hypothetical protein
MWVLVEALTIRRSNDMQAVTTVGLDIAKSVFQVHGVGIGGDVVIRRRVAMCWLSLRGWRHA